MNVAFYIRVSTPYQQQTHTIEQQLTRLHVALTDHPDWQIQEAHIYRDDGYSGATLNRPALDRLRDHAQQAAFERVLVTAPDRLARNYVHQMLLIDEFTQLGCPIEFIDRPMSDDPHDQLVLQIRGAVAEYERTLIRDRMRRGRLAKLQAGQRIPWTRPPYGYLLDVERPRDPSRVRLDGPKAAIVRQIFAWFTDPAVPATLYWVATHLNRDHIPPPRGGERWGVGTIRAILRDTAYTGTAYAGRTQTVPTKRRRSALGRVGNGTRRQQTSPEQWIPIRVPAIVSAEVFALAQARLDRTKQMARRNNKTQGYLLRGLVSCAQCRLSCSGRTSGRYPYYVCDGHRERARVERGEACRSRFTSVAALDTLVWEDLCAVLREPTLLMHELSRLSAGIGLPEALRVRQQTVADALAHVERQQARLLDVYLAEVVGRSEFERKRQELQETMQGLQQQLRQLDAQREQQEDIATLAQGITTFSERIQPTLDQLTFAQRRELVELLIDRVVVDDGKVEIRYVIPTSPKGEMIPFCHLRLVLQL